MLRSLLKLSYAMYGSFMEMSSSERIYFSYLLHSVEIIANSDALMKLNALLTIHNCLQFDPTNVLHIML